MSGWALVVAVRMTERAGALFTRAASPAALVSLLAILLLAVGGASAFARRDGADHAAVTVATVLPPSTEALSIPTAPGSDPLALQPSSPAATLAAAPATASPTASAPASPAATETAPSATPTPTPAAAVIVTPAPTPSAAPAPASVPVQPLIQSPPSVGVGEAFGVHVYAPGAASVSIEFNGGTYTAAPSGDRFWLVLGAPLEASPGPRTIRALARNAAGAVLGATAAPLQFTFVPRPVDYLELTEEQGSVLTEDAARLELQLRSAQFAQFDLPKRWAGAFLRPLFGAQTTAFGEGRSINGGPVGGFHSGMDIAADLGAPVHASAAGRVSWVGEMPIRGRSVIIDHGAGVKSGYHHLDATLVTVGSAVEAGSVVGAAGSTGLSTGPHLHWEVTVWGVNVDPLQWATASIEP